MAFTDYNKILLFGDSITEQSYEQTRGFGFGAALTNAYRRKLAVVSRGFSGYNTAHALHILPQIIPPATEKSKIKLVTVFFGANDAVLENLLQYVPLEQYRENLKKILTHEVWRGHDPKFVLIAPPPICEHLTQEHDKASGRDYVQRYAARTKEYSDAAKEVGRELGVPTVDLWSAFARHAGWKEGDVVPGAKEMERNGGFAELLRDGLHFNPKGYEIMYEEVMKVVVGNWPELDPEQMEFVFPHWEVAPRVAKE